MDPAVEVKGRVSLRNNVTVATVPDMDTAVVRGIAATAMVGLLAGEVNQTTDGRVLTEVPEVVDTDPEEAAVDSGEDEMMSLTMVSTQRVRAERVDKT